MWRYRRWKGEMDKEGGRGTAPETQAAAPADSKAESATVGFLNLNLKNLKCIVWAYAINS